MASQSARSTALTAVVNVPWSADGQNARNIEWRTASVSQASCPTAMPASRSLTIAATGKRRENE